ncbi:MAG TPA: methylmalonyl Co-A mutase-associated GTPase MeaB [Paracoccaceae bacterium]|nr:methylmalonyl Co-A mutase-associated GTPase MeaB [Paracoccaceae bacterium]
MTDTNTQARLILDGNRRALARAITLVESTRPDHREQALALLEILVAKKRQALRIGLSGTPGVGKSTFIEAFGMMLVAKGLKVAVLAVDPSSARTGGSILGDKTRMERLSRAPGAFIRPSPSQTTLGGVTRRTRESIQLCEAAGFDVILVETVGVGQSETMVADMTDVFLLLLAPAGGDELQGVKRGIMEIADIILVNKADGDLRSQALRTCADYAGALRLLRKRPQDPEGFPKALPISAYTNVGLDTTYDEITALMKWRRETGVFDQTRAAQALTWFRQEVENGLLNVLHHDPDVAKAWKPLENQIQSGDITPDTAARRILQLFLHGSDQTDDG